MALLRTPSGSAAGRSMGAPAARADLSPKPDPVSARPAPAALMTCRRVNMAVPPGWLFFLSVGHFFGIFLCPRGRNLKRSSPIIDRGNFDTPDDGMAAASAGCCYE